MAGLIVAYGNKNRKKYSITSRGERLVVSYEEIIGTITEFMIDTPQTVVTTVLK